MVYNIFLILINIANYLFLSTVQDIFSEFEPIAPWELLIATGCHETRGGNKNYSSRVKNVKYL